MTVMHQFWRRPTGREPANAEASRRAGPWRGGVGRRGMAAAILAALGPGAMAVVPHASAQGAEIAYKARAEGGPGGVPFEQLCARGEYLVGFAGREGAWIDQIQIICAVRVSVDTLDRPTLRGAAAGGQGGSPFRRQCGNWNDRPGIRGAVDLVRMDFTVRDGRPSFLNSIAWDCSFIDAPGVRIDNRRYLVGIPANPNPPGRHIVTQTCPDGELSVGIHGRAGQSVDALGLICGPALWRDVRPAPAPTAQDLLRRQPGRAGDQVQTSPGRLVPRN